jgi:hypothetical protein
MEHLQKKILPVKYRAYTLDEVQKKYKLKFNVLVADCEGFLCQFLAAKIQDFLRSTPIDYFLKKIIQKYATTTPLRNN